MGDLNFQDQHLSWKSTEDGLLFPVVHGHRQADAQVGVQVRQQAAKLCDLMLKHNMIQQVSQATRGREILDLIFVNNEDLVSSVEIESWPTFTDHSIVTASVSYKLEEVHNPDETHLLDSGRRLKRLNFNKANWQDIKAKLKNTDWAPMKELAKESPIAAHSWFIDTIIPILEEFVPQKGIKGSKWRSKEFKKRKSWLRKLGKIHKKNKQRILCFQTIQAHSGQGRAREIPQVPVHHHQLHGGEPGSVQHEGEP